MNTELLEALTILEEEKDISRDTLMDAIENSLINACKNHFGKADNIKVIMDKETCDYTLIQEKTVVEEVEDKVEQISLADAKMIDPSYEIGDIVQIPVLDVTTMSRTLDRMEQAGLLVRESNPDCRRSWLIALTDKGTDIAKKVQQIFEETDKIYCSNLSEKEAEQLFVLLQKVADNISQNCK